MFSIIKEHLKLCNKTLPLIANRLLFFSSSLSVSSLSLGPRLPLIDHLIDRAKQDSEVMEMASQTALISVQHGLRTVGSLFKGFLDLGMKSQNIHLMIKPYSKCQEVVDRLKKAGIQYQENSIQRAPGYFADTFQHDSIFLWARLLLNSLSSSSKIKNILILDEGGYLLSTTPTEISRRYTTIGIEQTMNGFMKPTINILGFPIIAVASSASKRYLEIPLIADVILEKLEKVWPLIKYKGSPCGVIGCGYIGTVIAKKLLAMGHKVYVYDKDIAKTKTQELNGAIVGDNLEAVLYNADYIFGCTGQDITQQSKMFDLSARDKVLISCSSGDDEFKSLLRMIQEKKQIYQSPFPLSDMEYINSAGARVLILKGGFPINFDESGVSVPDHQIQLTRGLLLLAYIQALKYMASGYQKRGKHMLDPKGQMEIYQHWRKLVPKYPYPKETLDKFSSADLIKEFSGGTYHPIDFNYSSLPHLTSEDMKTVAMPK